MTDPIGNWDGRPRIHSGARHFVTRHGYRIDRASAEGLVDLVRAQYGRETVAADTTQ